MIPNRLRRVVVARAFGTGFIVLGLLAIVASAAGFVWVTYVDPCEPGDYTCGADGRGLSETIAAAWFVTFGIGGGFCITLAGAGLRLVAGRIARARRARELGGD